MPLYEYQCDQCGHRFEVIQKFSDAPIAVCPQCGGPVQKLLSSPAIQFKGSGFYLTDYGRGNHPKEAKSSADKGDKADKTAKSDTASSSGGDAKSSGSSTTSETKSGGDAKPSSAAKSD